MVEDCLVRALAMKVPIEVVREVNNRSLIALCNIRNLEVILVVEVVDSLNNQLARVALLHILRNIGEYHTVGLHTTLPVAVSEALRATM